MGERGNATAMRLRRNISELTISDLERCPVWVQIGSIDDEEELEGDFPWTMTPDPSFSLNTIGSEKPLLMLDHFVVKSQFVLADGSVFPGFILNTGTSNFITNLQATILTTEGQVPFFSGSSEPSDDEVNQFYSRLGKVPDQIFPIRYTTTVKIVTRVYKQIKTMVFLPPYYDETIEEKYVRSDVAAPREGILDGFYHLSTTAAGDLLECRQ